MTKLRVLISAPYFQPVIERFRHEFDARGLEIVVPAVVERLSEQELLALIADIDGVIAGDDQFSERVIKAAPRLKVISKWGTGIDSIDRDACESHGVSVHNTPNAFTEPVADTVLGYTLSFARGIPWLDRAVKQGRWHKRPGRSLSECTLGVIGVGCIGKAVVKRASAFGMKTLGNDPLAMPDDFLEQTGVRMTDMEELLRESDFISLNCTLNSSSFHLLAGAEFAAMKPTAVIINTARGPIIDEPALIEALTRGEIAGAALDVFEAEPLPDDSPLCAMENVLLAPHNSNSSPAAWERVHRSTLQNLLHVLCGEKRNLS